MNIWMRLPPHPHIVPFDRIVVEELYGRQHVVGFTSLHIAGGTLDRVYQNPGDSRVFKLKWLAQLTSLVDDLNLKYGIQHQDVAPRNLLVDERTDNITLFDFNCAARIGGPLRANGPVYGEKCDDVKGVVFTLYEIITRDGHFRSFGVPHWEQNASSVLSMVAWVQHPEVRLDHSIAEYRAVLDDWMGARNARGNITVFTDAPEFIDWPNMQEPPCLPDERSSKQAPQEDAQHTIATCDHGDTPGDDSEDESVTPDTHNQGLEDGVHGGADPVSALTAFPRWSISRQGEWNSNRQVIQWERPAHMNIKKGTGVLANGKTIKARNST